MSKAIEEIDQFARQKMRLLLLQCTESQVNLFNRMYGSVNGVRDDQMATAFDQIERTLIKNQKSD